MLNIAVLPAAARRLNDRQGFELPFEPMVGMTQTAQMPAHATQWCVYDMVWRGGINERLPLRFIGLGHAVPGALFA